MVNSPSQKSPDVLVVFYKIRKQLINITFPLTVHPSAHNPIRNLHIQTLHTEAFKYHFYVRTVRLWNIFPSKIATATSKDTLKLQATAWITPMEWGRVNATWIVI